MMAWLISSLETRESYSDQCNNQGTHALALISLLVQCLAVARHLPQAELGLHAVAADHLRPLRPLTLLRHPIINTEDP